MREAFALTVIRKMENKANKESKIERSGCNDGWICKKSERWKNERKKGGRKKYGG
jgi:hypothetical protein